MFQVGSENVCFQEPCPLHLRTSTGAVDYVDSADSVYLLPSVYDTGSKRYKAGKFIIDLNFNW